MITRQRAPQHCADAILDAVACTDHFFPGSRVGLPDALRVALRVASIFSTSGNPGHRGQFEDAMVNHTWPGQSDRAKRNEVVVSPGRRSNWGLVIMSELPAVEAILARIGAP